MVGSTTGRPKQEFQNIIIAMIGFQQNINSVSFVSTVSSFGGESSSGLRSSSTRHTPDATVGHFDLL